MSTSTSSNDNYLNLIDGIPSLPVSQLESKPLLETKSKRTYTPRAKSTRKQNSVTSSVQPIINKLPDDEIIINSEITPVIDLSPQLSIDSPPLSSLESSHIKSIRLFSDEENNPEKTKLSIYFHHGYLIQHYHHHVSNIHLIKSVDPSSILVIDSNNKMVPFTYESNIDTKPHVEVMKNNNSYHGQLVSMTDTVVTFMVKDDIITLRNYDQILVKEGERLPVLKLHQPHNHIIVSYILNDISWECTANGLIDNNRLILRLGANIYNNTQRNINADVNLISGQMNSDEKSKGMMVRAVSNVEIPSTMAEEYTKYHLGNKTLLSHDLVEIATFNFPVMKIYVHNTNLSHNVKFGYRFISSEKLPKCRINLFSISQESLDTYLGSDNIDETYKNEDVDLIIGESTLVKCKSHITISNVSILDKSSLNKYKLPISKEWTSITENIHVEINNYNSFSVPFILKHFIGNKTILECIDSGKLENQNIEWNFHVPSGKSHFNCKLVMAS